eukprot:RCo025247
MDSSNPKASNAVLNFFDSEDFLEGYAIEFRPPTELERFDTVTARVSPGTQWRDDFEPEFPDLDGRRPQFAQPEEVPCWRGLSVSFIKDEDPDVYKAEYCKLQQGSLGDCWFSSALSSVAVAGRVGECVSAFDEEKGIYEFRFHGWDPSSQCFFPVFVCVDRRIPLFLGEDVPAYTFSQTAGEIWPSLLEKAFAKAIKAWPSHPLSSRGARGFAVMEGGLTVVALAHLLGGNCWCYWAREGVRWNPEDPAALAQLFGELFERGAFINVTFRELATHVVGPKGETAGAAGLVSGHVYTVLRLEVFAVRGALLRLVQLRNPWGRSFPGNPLLDWQGDWGADSPMWSRYPEAESFCRRRGEPQEGLLWMSVEDLAENMLGFEVCDAPERPPTTVQSKRVVSAFPAAAPTPVWRSAPRSPSAVS